MENVFLFIISLGFFISASAQSQSIVSHRDYYPNKPSQLQNHTSAHYDLFKAPPRLENRFVQQQRQSRRLPKSSKGFFNGSPASMQLETLRGASRHMQVL